MKSRQEVEAELQGSLPQLTPEQIAALGVGGAPVSLPLKAITAPVRAAGRGIKSLAEMLLGKAAGLAPAETKALQAAPDMVKGLARSTELQQSEKALEALTGASGKLKDRASGLTSELEQLLTGKNIPPAEVIGAGEFAPKTVDLITNQTPALDVYRAAQVAGKEAKFANNPLVVGAQKARAEEAGKAFSTLRGAVGRAAPEAEPTIAALKEGVDASSSLARAQKRPIAYLSSKSPDIAASRQAVDQLAGSSLNEFGGQLQAARGINREPQDMLGRFLKPAALSGLTGVRGAEAVGSAALGASEAGMNMGTRAAVAGNPPPSTKPQVPAAFDPDTYLGGAGFDPDAYTSDTK